MRLLSGGVAHIATVIEDDLSDRNTKLHKPHIEGLADLAAAEYFRVGALIQLSGCRCYQGRLRKSPKKDILADYYQTI